QITGVVVRETVPDEVLDRVDAIELIDLPPEQLLQRLGDGKIYVPEQARRAALSFFQHGNLLALRELALRRTAERVDADVRAYRELHAVETTWAASEKILVCVGPAPASARLLRAARRMAAGLSAPWVAVSVDVATAAPLPVPARDRLEGHLRLAESLGATVAQVSGDRISDALVAYACTQHVTRIVIGKRTHPRWRDLLRGSIVEEVVRASGSNDVHVITGDPAPDATPIHDAPREASALRAYVLAGVTVALATGLLGGLRSSLLLPDVVAVYLSVIMLLAVRFPQGPTFFASLLSVAAYDLFFIPPFYALTVDDLRHVLTFAVMLATAFLISTLSSRLRRQELAARERMERTAALLNLSRALAVARDDAQAAGAVTDQLVTSFGGGAAVYAQRGEDIAILAQAGNLQVGRSERSVVKWVLDHGKPAGRGTDTLPGAAARYLPLTTPEATLGALALSPELSSALSGDQRALLEAFARQLTVALERHGRRWPCKLQARPRGVSHDA
ncbi:MAG: DUF4118 domain-containing protein, partial [Myxococcales bacterium]|nr:DUF4118 domain-containing protein [Myxococcales bacterium]